jgi:hypothetical protein
MDKDQRKYFGFTTRSRLDKAVNSLVGLIEGIALDGAINQSEISFIHRWLDDNSEYSHRHPFNELIPVVKQAVSDGILSDDERKDILWLCEQLVSTEYYDLTTADLQRLHAILGGIASDGIITVAELRGLSDWLIEHEHLKSCWPYDEVDSLITTILADQKIDDSEHNLLMDLFTEYTAILDSRTIVRPKLSDGSNLVGLCAVCPNIVFQDSKFCITGKSFKYSRDQFSDLIKRLGGEFVNSVSSLVNYLIIGADGNPCWAYACYGRKVEEAVALRKNGVRIALIHENDFHDAVADKIR